MATVRTVGAVPTVAAMAYKYTIGEPLG